MGFIDNLVESAFKEMEDGVCVYYPYGAFSKGRVVPDNKTRTRLYNFQKLTMKYGFPIIILWTVFGGFRHHHMLPFAFPLLVSSIQYALIRQLPIHDSKISENEIYKKSFPDWYITSSIVLGVVLMLASSLLFVPKEADYYMPAFCFLLGLLLVLLSVRIRKKKYEA